MDWCLDIVIPLALSCFCYFPFFASLRKCSFSCSTPSLFFLFVCRFFFSFFLFFFFLALIILLWVGGSRCFRSTGIRSRALTCPSKMSTRGREELGGSASCATLRWAALSLQHQCLQQYQLGQIYIYIYIYIYINRTSTDHSLMIWIFEGRLTPDLYDLYDL